MMNFGQLSLLFRCSKNYSHTKLQSAGISESECMICSFVCENENCSQDDVSKGLALDKTTVAKAIKRLEKKKYLVRKKDKYDARKNILKITESGKETVCQIIVLHDKWFEEVTSVLDKNEQKLFEEYLLRILKRAKEISDKQRKGQDNEQQKLNR